MMREEKKSFSQVYESLSTSELLRAYNAGPARLRQVLSGLTESDLSARPRAGKWSIKEIVSHMLDSDLVGATRIRQAFAQPGSRFLGYDQDIWSKELDYQNRSAAEFEQVVNLFENLRTTSNLILQKATAKHWEQKGMHAEWGEITLRQLLELYADHSERHIEQIVHLRELIGKSISFPALLQARLY